MNILRLQGFTFSLAALLVVAAALIFQRLEMQTELIWFAVLTMLLGVPHGALDPIFAQQLYGVKGFMGWARFALVYTAASALLLALWWIAPTSFLVVFLAASVAHFSGDLPAKTPILSRILYGGAIIILPMILHAAEVAPLFAALIGIEATSSLLAVLGWMAWPWLAGLVVAAIVSARTDGLTALEIIAVSALAVVASPLLAFAVFFCGMHSARHILRTQQYAGRASARRLISWSVLPMLAVCVALAAAWHGLKDAPFDTRVVQIVFVTLAILTGPHMVLIEQVRLAGWGKGGEDQGGNEDSTGKVASR